MKKIIFILAGLLALCSISAQAKVGDVIGDAYHTDIVAYINHYAIPSYAVNGTSCIVAEDLRNFGFDVNWDNNTRSLNISRNSETVPKEMSFKKEGKPSAKFADLLETDLSVYAAGVKLSSYAMNGYTMIPIEELTMFGQCFWVNEERAIKLWIDGVTCRAEKQAVAAYVEPSPQQTDPKYAHVRKALEDCKRYVTYLYYEGETLTIGIDLYRMTKKASYFADITDNVIDISNYFSKIYNICSDIRELYPLKLEADRKMPSVTSSNLAGAATYARNASRTYVVYNLLCETYGVSKVQLQTN